MKMTWYLIGGGLMSMWATCGEAALSWNWSTNDLSNGLAIGELSLTAGPQTISGGSAGGIWNFSVTVSRVDGHPDERNIDWSLQHVQGPHGEGPGAIAASSAYFLAGGNTAFSKSWGDMAGHAPHQDFFTITVNYAGPATTEDYEVRVSVFHTPTPGPIAIAALGGLAICRRRRET